MTKNLGLTNNYVQLLCKTLTGSYFVGVFPCNLLKTKSKEVLRKVEKNIPFSMIINLSPDHHEGSHFVALSYRDNDLILFDSLGLKFDDPNIKAFVSCIQEKCKKVKFTKLDFQIQSFYTSALCGFYVSAYVFSQSKGYESIETFLDQFHTHKEKLFLNDKTVIMYICDFIYNL